MFKQMRDFMSKMNDSNANEANENNEDQIKDMLENLENEAVDESTNEALAAELEEAKDKYLRLFAEFDNYKKRVVKERFDLMRTAAQETLQALLPVLDDFDRAKKSAETGAEVFSEGVQLVYNKLHSILEAKGLKAMETDGEPFDAEFHEAITDIPAPDDSMKGIILDTVEKGYILNDKIIRHAKVVIGK